MADSPSYPGTPRWVKVSGIAVGFLVLLVAVLIHAGGGPHHNLPSSDAGGQIQPSNLTENSTPFGGGVGGHTRGSHR